MRINDVYEVKYDESTDELFVDRGKETLRKNIGTIDSFNSTQFSRTLIVGSTGALGLNTFATIRAAINEIKTWAVADRPTKENPATIWLMPGTYAESKLFLPHWVSLRGSGRAVTRIVGTGSGSANCTVICGRGSIVEGITFDSSGYSSKIDALVFMPGDGWFGTPLHQSEYGAISNGDTLILQGDSDPVDTFTFVIAGDPEVLTANQIATAFNTASIGWTALVYSGRVYLADNLGRAPTLKSTGTANAALGYPTAYDTEGETISVYSRQYPVLRDFSIDGSLGYRALIGVYSGAFWSTIHDGTVYNCDVGIWVEFGNSTIRDIYAQECMVNCLTVGTDLVDTVVLAEVENCELWGNIGATDIIFKNSLAYMKAKTVNYRSVQYATADSVGVIHPTGMRNTLEFIVTGTLSAVNYIDNARPIHYNSVIEGITVLRMTAGDGGSMVIDINKNDVNNDPTTLYLTAANQPTIANTDGDRFVLKAALPDTRYLAAGDWISVDVDSVETGTPAGLVVQVHLMRIGEV